MIKNIRTITSIALALSAGSAAYAETKYEIYPLPQKVEYQENTFKISDSVNIVFEKGIDKYTINRLQKILSKSGIAFRSSKSMIAGKTNILVGINQSGEFVDKYFNRHVAHKEVFFDRNDSHIVSVKNNVIAVLGDDTDSAFYGLTTLKHVFNQLDENQIQEFRIDDYSNVKHRGFIEGYYGNPWSNEDRAELMRFGGDYKLNTYFFAPKDDLYHNKKWRELYPEKELAAIKKLAQVGNETKNKYVYALHTFMYNPVRFDNETNYQNDLNIIKAKFTQLLENDVRAFSVLADDAGVPAQGPGSYVKLLKDLTAWFKIQKKTYPDLVIDIPFCSNDYMGNGSSAQLKVVNEAPASVSIIMTGGRIWGEVSEGFTSNFKKNIGSEGLEGRPPYLWINWPCSDNSHAHLIMGGNDTFLHPGVEPDNIQGIILNPMQQAEANKSALFAIADYSWNVWDNKEQADQNWHDSFKYMDHGTAEENKTSTALRTISKHMINQNMDGRVRVLHESLELAPKLDDLKKKLKAGTLTKEDTAALIKEFQTLKTAAAHYRENAGNKRTRDQIIYWLDCWEDTTTAAIHYLQCLDAVIDKDNEAIWNHYSAAHTSFEKSKTHKFLYINHYPNAEVGVQHIVPFIKEVSMHLNGIVSAIVDPSRVAQNDIDKKAIAESYKLTASASKDIAIRMGGGLKNIVDGNVSSGPSFAPTPYTGPDRDSTPLNAFIRVDLDKAEIIGLITIAQAKGDKLKKAALEYTTDGSTWQLLKTFDKSEATLTFDASELDLKATALRIRNLEPSKKWWAVKEFTVNYPKKKSIRKGFTNTNHKLEVQVSLAKSALIPVKGLKLNPNDYVGIKLDRIKDLKNLKSMISNGKLDLQVSVNAIEWQTAAHDKLAGIDARYIRLINKSDKTLTVDVDQLEVTSNEIHPLSLVKAHAKIYKKSKAEQAFDNDFNSTVFFDKGFSTGESIVYDLGQSIDIEDLKYVVLDTDTDHVRDAKFQLSLDGNTWTDAFETTSKSEDRDAKPQDNGYKHGSLSNGVIPISHSYLEGKNLNTKARYFRILATKSYHHRWIRISEVLINNGQYIKQVNDPTFVSDPIEMKDHGPEKMFDGDLTTAYQPNTNNGKITSGSITYKLSEKTNIKQINIVQNGNAISNAKVMIRTGKNEWQQLGVLDKSLNELKNTKYKHIYELKIVWSGVAPSIYEVALASTE